MVSSGQPLPHSSLERTLAAIRRDLFILKCEMAVANVAVLLLLIFG